MVTPVRAKTMGRTEQILAKAATTEPAVFSGGSSCRLHVEAVDPDRGRTQKAERLGQARIGDVDLQDVGVDAFFLQNVPDHAPPRVRGWDNPQSKESQPSSRPYLSTAGSFPSWCLICGPFAPDDCKPRRDP
jgi:hypothetical protein